MEFPDSQQKNFSMQHHGDASFSSSTQIRLYNNILWITCISLYGTFLVFLPLLCMLLYSKVMRQSRFISLFLICLWVSMCSRLSWFILSFVTNEPYLANYYKLLERSYPDFVSLLFIFSYLILSMYWFSTYHSIRKKYQMHTEEIFNGWKFRIFLFMTFGLIMFIALAILATCHVLLSYFSAKMTDSQVYLWIVICGYFPILTLVISLLFSIIAMKLYSDVLLTTMKTHENHKKLKKIALFTGTCLSWLFFQSVARVFLSVPVFREKLGVYLPFLDLAFFVAIEFIPNVVFVLQLFIFHRSLCERIIWKMDHQDMLITQITNDNTGSLSNKHDGSIYTSMDDTDSDIDDGSSRLYNDVI
jgi:hypothetical protein